MANVSLSFDIDELINLNNQMNNSYNSIDINLANIRECYEELNNNVTGTQVNNNLVTITDKMAQINSKMTTSYEELNEFLQKQMNSYSMTYDEALQLFKDALTFIDNNF